VLCRLDALALGGILLLTSIVFANGLAGEFVHDDQKQILRNDLIRSPRFWAEALSRDVWAFQGERQKPWSNYWRPGHVGWLIANYQVFGPRPFPWHVMNLLAHLGVIACAYVFLRQLGATTGLSAAICAIFAVHPTRCESVTWIAGAHDVLATLWQLIALLMLMSIWRSATPRMNLFKWAAALAAYALAVCTKEIAVFFPVIVALVRFTDPSNAEDRARASILPALPFAAVAAGFLIVRQWILGSTQLPFPGQPDWSSALGTLPLVIMYYLRLILFPLWIGWSYPVDAVTGSNRGVFNFFGPLGLLIAVILLAQRIVRGRIAVIGSAIFVLSLLPALNVRGLHPEQLVKDRYLYLPLLGFLMAVGPAVYRVLRSLPAPLPAALVGFVVLLLSIRTAQYNRAWRDDVSLWQWAVRSDPGSASNHELLATAYLHEKQYDLARDEYGRAIALQPGLTDAYIGRAEVSLQQQRWEEAAADCRRVLEVYPDDFRASERLAMALERQDRWQESLNVLRQARERMPYRKAGLTVHIAKILYTRDQKAEALAELESVRNEAETDFAPASRQVLYYLGMLYREQGRSAEASTTLRRFLDLTHGSGESEIVALRSQAIRALQSPGR
jgi:tetratricopeptide (TPR) repeat protein